MRMFLLLLTGSFHPLVFGSHLLLFCFFYRLSIRQKRGKVVEVYDGRKWPVVSVDVFKTVFLISKFVTRKRVLTSTCNDHHSCTVVVATVECLVLEMVAVVLSITLG